MDTCPICSKPLTPATGTRPRVYCSGACRTEAYRRRKAVAFGPSRRVQPRAIPPRQRKPTVEDLTRLIVDAHALEAAFRFAAEHADYKMRPMCSRIADAITVALDAEGLSHG